MDTMTSPNGRRLLWAGFALFVAFLYAPIVVLVMFSFNDSSIPAFPIEGLTTKWYGQLFDNQVLLDAIRTSAVVAGVTAVVTVALGVLAAIVLVRKRFFGKPAFSALIISPLVIPYVVLGIALLILFRRIGIELSMWTVVAGHVVLSLPFTVLVLAPRLEKIDRRLEEAARDLGAGGLRTFTSVTLPLLTPALFSAFIIAFTISFDEYAVASFVVGDDVTFPVYLFSQLRFPGRLPQVIAVAVLVMALSALIVLAAEAGRRLAERRLDQARLNPGA